MLPLYKNLCKMIELAMKEKAPQMYARLKASGELSKEIHRRAEEATNAYYEMVMMEPKEKVLERQKKSPMDQIAERTMQKKVAAEIALSQALEFPTENEKD